MRVFRGRNGGSLGRNCKKRVGGRCWRGGKKVVVTFSPFGSLGVHRVLAVDGEHVCETFVITVMIGGGEVMGHEFLDFGVVDCVREGRHLGE